MREHLVAFLAGAMLMLASTSFALPVVNTAHDGIEDLTNGSAYATYQNSGTFLYNEAGNNLGNFAAAVQAKLDTFLGINIILTEDTNVAYTGSNGPSGTWTVTPVGNTIDFYVVKAANAYAMYEVNPADGQGSWSTFDLWSAGYGGRGALDVSHFTGYNPGSAPVPEPGTMMLLGAGFLGLAVYGKRRRNV